MENQEVKILSTCRGRVEYLDLGQGRPVLALHGAMGGYDQASILSRTVGPASCRYICLSRPGYLGTPLSAGRTPEEQADLYAETLDLLEITHVLVMAISGGGPSAIHFALRYPDRCRGLVLISTCGGRTTNRIPVSFHIMTLLSRWPAFVAMMKSRVEKNLEKSLARSISSPDILRSTVGNADVMSLFKELTVGAFDRMAERIEGTKNDIRITRTRTYPLKDITVPTLVIHGTRDPLVPFEAHGRRLAEEIPGAQLLAVDCGEHVTIFTHRNEVQAKVAGFLQDLDPTE